jgi:hypothetical protein
MKICSDARFAFRSSFYFDFSDPHDALSLDEFRRIEAEVEAWSNDRRIPHEIERTNKGFKVVLNHPVVDGDGFGLSLYLHLSSGLFREMESEMRKTYDAYQSGQPCS